MLDSVQAVELGTVRFLQSQAGRGLGAEEGRSHLSAEARAMTAASVPAPGGQTSRWFVQQTDGDVVQVARRQVPEGARTVLIVRTTSGTDTFAQVGEGMGFFRKPDAGVLGITAASGWSIWYSTQHWLTVEDPCDRSESRRRSPQDDGDDGDGVVAGADEDLQRRVNPGGVGLPVTAQTLGDLLVRVSMYGLAVRDDSNEIMGGQWGHVATLIDKLGQAAGLEVDAIDEVYRSEAARLGVDRDMESGA